jgi:glycosyltransferase involved in cell wall biosynthesis
MADGGGAQKYVLDLAEHFGGSIAAGTEADQLFKEAGRRGIKTFPLHHLKRNVDPRHDLAAIFEIKQLIKKEHPDIVHLNSSKAGFIGSIAGGLAGTKVVFTAHGFFYFKNSPWYVKAPYAALEWIASRFRSAIIAVSEEDREQGIKHHLLPADKIITIYNGIPAIPFLAKQEARQKLGLKQDKLILGNIAQLYNRKAIDVLIKAAALLPKDIKDKIQIAVIGEGPERKNLERQIKNHNLEPEFILVGYKPMAVTLLKAFDIFVSSSRREGFSYVFLEVLQAGLPSIATDVGGNKEALADCCILIPSQDPAAMAKAIEELINNPEKQTELSQRALRRSQQFTLEKMFSETEKVYKKLKGS